MVSLAALALSAWLLIIFGIIGVYVYVDAPNYGMDRTKWAVIAFAVPIFGGFAYLLERSERKDTGDRDMFEEGVVEIHESRADDTRLASGTPEEEILDDEEAEQFDDQTH